MNHTLDLSCIASRTVQMTTQNELRRNRNTDLNKLVLSIFDRKAEVKMLDQTAE